MRVSDSSPAPSPRSSLRAWLNLGSPAICKGVSSSSIFSSPASSRQSSFRLPSLSSGRLSFRKESITSENGSKTTPKNTPKQQSLNPPNPNPRPNPNSIPVTAAATPPLPPRRSSASSISSTSSSSRVAQLKNSISNSKLRHSKVAQNARGTPAGGYALALAELSESLGILSKVMKDVENLNRVLEHEELLEFLTSTEVADEKKKKVLRTLAADGNFQDQMITFLNVLVDKKRVGILKDVLTQFENICYDLNDTEVATVTSAVKMEPSQLQVIAKKIQGLTGVKNIRIRNVVDESLMAGYVVRYGANGSKVLDMSVKDSCNNPNRLLLESGLHPTASRFNIFLSLQNDEVETLSLACTINSSDHRR
ncbi:hypothetical protein R1sor_004572 [Riccia sorocarpa]|uniref:ATP synthase delta chain, chloroplastic n=1 Tax=Riccia sorocarpa TaxID=122646 RepID=A0ABD3HJA3_9MARC